MEILNGIAFNSQPKAYWPSKMAMNPVRRRLDTSVHRFVRASSRTRTQHRGTRTRTRSDLM